MVEALPSPGLNPPLREGWGVGRGAAGSAFQTNQPQKLASPRSKHAHLQEPWLVLPAWG